MSINGTIQRMPKRCRDWSLLPPLAGAALAYAFVRHIQRQKQVHAVESKAARDDYCATFSVRRRFALIDGCRTHLYEAGVRDTPAPPLLLIHGGFVEGASWLNTLAALGQDRYVIAPDLPAHGASGYLPPARLLNWLDALIESELYPLLGDPRRQFDLCSHSMGGKLCLYYVSRPCHRVRRLILCAPVGTGQIFPRVWPEWGKPGLPPMSSIHNALLDKVWGDSSQITQVQRRQFHLLWRDFFFSRRWWWYLWGGMQWLFDIPRPLLQTITIPTLFVWGERDHIVPFQGERTLAYVQAISGAQIRFLSVCGHMPQLEASAELCSILHVFLVD